MKFKNFFLVLLVLIFTFIAIPHTAYAESTVSDKEDLINKYYKEQLKTSGAEDLLNELPQETKNSLSQFGVDDFNWKSITQLKPESVFSELSRIVKDKSPTPFKTLIQIIGIIILCALMEGLKISFSESALSEIIGMISVLCICLVIINPVVNCIASSVSIIKTAARFMLCYIPVIAGLMLASGQTFSAASYNMIMIGVSEIIVQLSSNLLLPLLNTFLSLSIVSSISTKLSFKGICDTVITIFKWVLGLVMTVFVSILGLQTIVSGSADSIGLKTAKFMISSFVPVVGSALGDAFSIIKSSVYLLRSGIGAFGLIAIGFIFVPPLIESILWIISLNTCAAVGEIFNLSVISNLLKNTSKVVGLIIAVMLCCMAVLIISTVIVLKTGGT